MTYTLQEIDALREAVVARIVADNAFPSKDCVNMLTVEEVVRTKMAAGLKAEDIKAVKQIHYWDGRPVESLSHEELLAAFNKLATLYETAVGAAHSSQMTAARMMQLAARQIRATNG